MFQKNEMRYKLIGVQESKTNLKSGGRTNFSIDILVLAAKCMIPQWHHGYFPLWQCNNQSPFFKTNYIDLREFGHCTTFLGQSLS